MVNIIVSEEIKVYEAAQLWEWYIINFKLVICMLETNVNNFSEGGGSYRNLWTETKGDDIREEVQDKSRRIISFQNKALKCHAEKLKENFNYALKEANYSKLSQKEEKYQVLGLQECMDKTILKLATLKISTHFNM